ncbi:MAG: TrkA family potassium uptake protein [Clostridia bacterium]|nr:TrkA family potassium uptake protein [Clostridia bacterium]
MKSILVIGMGRLGRHLAATMTDLGNEVMVIDKDPEVIESLSPAIVDANIGDCTNENVIKALGVDNFDICFVTIDSDFQSSLVVTSLLKTFGANLVVSTAKRDIQADLLKKIGADEVVYPEREIAEKLAVRYNSSNIFDFIKLTPEYAIYEIPTPAVWTGKTISNLGVRQHYKVNIIAIKQGNTLNTMPGPDYIFKADDHVIVIGKAGDVFKLSSEK